MTGRPGADSPLSAVGVRQAPWVPAPLASRSLTSDASAAVTGPSTVKVHISAPSWRDGVAAAEVVARAIAPPLTGRRTAEDAWVAMRHSYQVGTTAQTCLEERSESVPPTLGHLVTEVVTASLKCHLRSPARRPSRQHLDIDMGVHVEGDADVGDPVSVAVTRATDSSR